MNERIQMDGIYPVRMDWEKSSSKGKIRLGKHAFTKDSGIKSGPIPFEFLRALPAFSISSTVTLN